MGIFSSLSGPKYQALERPTLGAAPTYANAAPGDRQTTGILVDNVRKVMGAPMAQFTYLGVAEMAARVFLINHGEDLDTYPHLDLMTNAASTGASLAEAENLSRSSRDGHIERNHAGLYSSLRRGIAASDETGHEWAAYLFDAAYFLGRTGTAIEDLIGPVPDVIENPPSGPNASCSTPPSSQPSDPSLSSKLIGHDPRIEQEMLSTLKDEYGITEPIVRLAFEVLSTSKGYREVTETHLPQWGEIYANTKMSDLIGALGSCFEAHHCGRDSVERGRAGAEEYRKAMEGLLALANGRRLEAFKTARASAGAFASERKRDAAVQSDEQFNYWVRTYNSYAMFFLIACVLRDASYRLGK